MTELKNLPLVTIVAISYNQERYVIDALNSIKNQTYKNIQLIIADDASKDGTKDLIKNWIAENWPNAIFLNHTHNKGIPKNLNSALPYIKGKYYQFLGCEDNLLPKKISLQVKLLEENPEYGVVYTDMQRMDVNGKLEEKTQYTFKNTNVPISGWVYDALLERCFISTPSALMRTEVLFSIGGDNEKLEVNDYDFWIRASKKYQFLYNPAVTIQYRVLPTSVSNKKGIFVYRNGFLMLYFNYDRRKKYRKIFNKKMRTGIVLLKDLKFRKTAIFSLKAFIKSGDLKFLFYAFKTFPLLFFGENG